MPLSPPAPQEHALPFNCHPTGRVPALPVHLCLVPTSALPWLILLEQRQELAKLRRRNSLPEDKGDGKEYSLSGWSLGWGWLWGGALGSRLWGGTAGAGQALGPGASVMPFSSLSQPFTRSLPPSRSPLKVQTMFHPQEALP